MHRQRVAAHREMLPHRPPGHQRLLSRLPEKGFDRQSHARKRIGERLEVGNSLRATTAIRHRRRYGLDGCERRFQQRIERVHFVSRGVRKNGPDLLFRWRGRLTISGSDLACGHLETAEAAYAKLATGNQWRATQGIEHRHPVRKTVQGIAPQNGVVIDQWIYRVPVLVQPARRNSQQTNEGLETVQVQLGGSQMGQKADVLALSKRLLGMRLDPAPVDVGWRRNLAKQPEFIERREQQRIFLIFATGLVGRERLLEPSISIPGTALLSAC